MTEWFQQYDALYLLSYCSFYYLSHPEGTDPEMQGSLDFYPFYLEILQAFALMQERSFSSKPLDREAYELLDLMGAVGDAIAMRSWKDLGEASQEEIRQWHVLMTMRTQTTAIRNWAYPQHIRKVTYDLAETVRYEFMEKWGVDPVKVLDVLFGIAAIAQDRLNEHLARIRSFYHQHSYQQVVQSYVKAFPQASIQDPEQLFDLVGRNVQHLKTLLVAHSDLRLPDHLTFTLDDFEGACGGDVDRRMLRAVFDALAFEFGELSRQDREYVILDNPVWRKPFIKIDRGVYFSAVVGLIPHYALDILETLVSADPTMEERYRKRKARYLEDELVRLFSESFPRAEIHRGTLWDDGMGSHGENDVVTIVDTVAIVAEAKSGLISPPASRGAPDRFKRTVKELIDEPAQQAYDFIQVLKSLQGPFTFQAKDGSENTIDPRGIRYYIPLTVTLGQFGLVSNLQELVEAGFSTRKLSELAPVISLTDLMAIFEVLNLQSERLHYLARRTEFAIHRKLLGDELDLFAFYLDQGLNVGQLEYEEEGYMILTMASKQLDPYFLGQDAGKSIDKPGLALTEMWRSILQRLEVSPYEHWLDSALLLLNVPYVDQRKFERRFRSLTSQIRRGKVERPHNWVVLIAGPPEREFFIALFPYRGIDRDVRNSVIAEILEYSDAKRARGAICIGMDLDYNRLPYSVVALSELPDLFDEL